MSATETSSEGTVLSIEYAEPEVYSDRDWSSFNLDVFDRNTIHTYREPEALHYLYVHESWTQQEIASRFNVDRSTISRWLSLHEISKDMSATSVERSRRGGAQ